MIAFWILAPVMVVCALGLLFARKAVHCALLLAVVMISLSILYVVQGAPFLFAVQIIVYTGAILMLFLFVLMLVGVELVLEGALRTPVGGAQSGVAHDVARHPDAAGLVVLVVPAGVADVRRGGDDDLAVIAGVGQGLLVARHRGGEHRLAEGLADGSEGPAAEGAPVLENQQGR